MRKMLNSGVNYIDEYPETWKLTKIKYLLKERNDRSLTGEEMLLSVSQYLGVIPSSENKMKTMQAGSLVGYKIVKKGDLVFNKLNPGLARFGCSKYDGITSPDFAVYIPNHLINSTFMSYLLKSERYVTLIKSLGAGVGDGFARLYTPQLYSFTIALPEPAELTAITNYLDKKCGEIDEITNIIEEQIEMLENYKKSIVTEISTRGLNPNVKLKDSGILWVGQIPENWDVIKGKYCFTNDKYVVGAQVDDYERLALTMNGVIKRSKDDNNGLQPEKFNTYQILRENELVFKLIDLQNVSTSRVGLSPYTGIVSPAYIILKSRGNIDPRFAEKYYLSMWMNQIFNFLGDAGVRSSLNAEELLKVELPLPPLAEQKAIADFLDKKCGEIDEIISAKREELAKIDSYKKSLIYEYVTGKKEVAQSEAN